MSEEQIVSLTKNQTISLTKRSKSITKPLMGLFWIGARKQSGGFLQKIFGSAVGDDEIDLDASCIVHAKDGRVIDKIWFRKLTSSSSTGRIQHTGDDRVGSKTDEDRDNEQIVADLQSLSPEAHSLIYTINSFSGQSFEQIAKAGCRVRDANTNKIIAEYNLTESGNHTGMIVAAIYRSSDGWNTKAIGQLCHGRTIDNLVDLTREIAITL